MEKPNYINVTPQHVRRNEMTDRDSACPHVLMEVIGRGIPITLLVDLVDPNGPRSGEMFEREGMDPDQVARWLRQGDTAETA